MTKKQNDVTSKSKKEEDAELNEEGEQGEAEPVEEAEEGAEGEEGDDSLKEEDTDYEALAETERQRDADARKGAADEAFKQREAKRKGKDGKKKESEEEDEEDEDAPLTRKDLTSILARDRAEGRKEAQESQALEIARANTSSEAEAKAAVTFWKTRVTPTGDLSEDVLFAIAGMNRKRTAVKISEVARAAKAKDNTTRSAAGTHRDGPEAPGPKLSANDASAIKAAGMVWDGTKSVYKKPLNGGKKHLYFDPKTKKRWTSQ